MEGKTKKSAAGRVVSFLVLLLLLFFLLEGLFSIYVYQRVGTEKMALIESLKRVKAVFTRRQQPSINASNHFLVRPDSSETVNTAIAEETIKSNKFVYRSWVDFRSGDFDGTYMHMEDGIRRSSPSEYISPSSSDTIDIYFFGGSTMFGFNVQDHETIPSQLVDLYREKYPNGKSIRVVNYAIPTYYSYQELMLFSDLIYRNHRPDIVVFLDGINDFWFATSSYYRQSYFSYVFRQVFNQELGANGNFKFVDTADAMFKNPRNIPLEHYNTTITNNYVENMRNIGRMADLIGAKRYFFCQPAPFYNYPNQQNDPMCFKDTSTRFNDIYPVLEQKAGQLPHFTFLGNMLKDERGYPFVDGLHYSPGFIRKISGEILQQLEKDL